MEGDDWNKSMHEGRAAGQPFMCFTEIVRDGPQYIWSPARVIGCLLVKDVKPWDHNKQNLNEERDWRCQR